MKTQIVKLGRTILPIAFIALSFQSNGQSQPKPTAAIVSIDSRTGIAQDAQTITSMVYVELEKTGIYTVMDRYEVAKVIAKNNISPDNCYDKTCLVETGKLLGVNKMLSGSVELLGDKIVITLRLIDVASGTIEKSDANEYLDLPEMQKMVRISVQKILGIQPDKVVMDQLMNYDVPIQSPRNALHLNGPRIGCSHTMGRAGDLMTAEAPNGLNMYPVTFDFGWQQEIQYISAGNFQALVENVFMISGLESGRFIPNYAPLLGFRFGKPGWEFAFGPTFRYFDIGDRHPFTTGLVIAVGRTFRSGYLNIPVNAYVVPKQDATTVGITFGFNIQKKDQKSKTKNTRYQ